MRVILVVLSAALMSCSAGPPPCVPKVVTVVLAGDSTQLGMTASAPKAGLHRVAVGPAELLQEAMDRRFGKGSVTVIQAAAGGARAVGVPLTVMERINTFISDIGNRPPPPDISISNYGINDMLEGVPLGAYADALRDRAPTIYETPNPTVNGMDEYAKAMREVARGAGAVVADVDA